MNEKTVAEQKRITMKEMPASERPYERFESVGPEGLTDAELLAVILRTGSPRSTSLEMAREVLTLCPYEEGLSGLAHVSSYDLQTIKGIGFVKAAEIKCIVELAARIATARAKARIQFSDPGSIADYFMERLRHKEQEYVIACMFDTKNHFLGDTVISKGTVNNSLISPRELFLEAMQFHAVCIVLIHNHPSGDATPSNEDLLVTTRIQICGDLLDIPLLDHIIIGDGRYISLKAEGLMENPEEDLDSLDF